jgi:hypothetical protein
MDEGVDPTRMCQSLVDKIAQSRQLISVAHPEILVLFENWLEELESELIEVVQKTGVHDPVDVAEVTGLSRSGTKFLIAKLRREGKL